MKHFPTERQNRFVLDLSNSKKQNFSISKLDQADFSEQLRYSTGRKTILKDQAKRSKSGLVQILLGTFLIPLEAERITSGNWGVVAIWVTQPPWPWRVPRKVICSDIF